MNLDTPPQYRSKAMISRHQIHAVATVVLVLVLAACGASSDDTSDQPSGEEAGGELIVGGDLDLPSYFPSDFYVPAGLTIKSISESPSSEMISLSGTFESGDVAEIQADMVAGLQAAGYELLTDDDIAVFVRNGVGRVRVRTAEFLGELTLSVDIDTWTDEQLDELRSLFAEEVVVPGRATAEIGDETLAAEGECTLKGTSRSFFAEDVSITIQIDETRDPVYVYADMTMPDGRVFTIDATVDSAYASTPQQLTASGEMTEYYNEAAGTLPFAITATCDG
jgi:hypothetical protein